MSQSTTTIPLFTQVVKTQAQIRGDILRTLANHLQSIGIANPNVGQGSDYYGLADGVATEICVGLSNGIISVNNQMPDTAGGTFLDRWLALFGLSRNGSTNSMGVITPAYSLTTGYTAVPTGAVLIDSVGLRYRVTIGGSYGPGNPTAGQPANLNIPVESLDAGSATNHANGDTLQWVTYVAFVGPNASVGTTGGTDGLSGGNDSEVGQDEPPRKRLFSLLQNPPGGGNWNDVVQWAQQSTPDVQAAFCYPALIGPATVFFAVMRAAQSTTPLSSTSKNRSLVSTIVSGTVLPYVQGKYSTRACVVGISTIDQPTDVALVLSLPSAATASPSGPGGGWLDGTPWPTTTSGGAAATAVTAVASSTKFTVNASVSPIVGVSQIAYVSPSNWQLYKATVLTASGSPGAFVITIDTPWPNLSTDFAATGGPFIFPQAVNQVNYLAQVLQAFANLGPGEWAAPTSPAFVRGFRHPVPSQAWPSSLDANFERTVQAAGVEVLTVSYAYRSATSPTVPSAPVITAADPFSITNGSAPSVLVPRNFAWYQQ